MRDPELDTITAEDQAEAYDRALQHIADRNQMRETGCVMRFVDQVAEACGVTRELAIRILAEHHKHARDIRY